MAPKHDVVFFAPYAGPLLAARAGLAGGGAAGGAETQVLLLARALRRRGHRVAVAAFDIQGGLPAAVDGVGVIRLPRSARGRRLRLIAALVRHVDATVLVQRSAGSATGLIGLLSRARRRRFVYSSAADIDFDFDRLARDASAHRLFPLGIRCASAIVVQTDVQAELCRRHWGRDCVVIRSIAEPAPQLQREPEAFLWIGRMAPYKRPEIFGELAERIPQARFWMVGSPSDLDPGLYDRMRELAEARPNLEMLPTRPRDQLGGLYERAVAVVSTSVFEGMPNVFLEGWARGVPALALSHDPDGIIERNQLGWVAGDAVDRLAGLAAFAWKHRSAQREIAARCRGYVAAEHGPEQVAARWERALGLSAPSA